NYAVADSGALLARANGAPIKVLKAVFQHSPLALIVRKDSALKRFSDLRGKRIMMAPGLNADIIAMLGAAGISSGDFVRQDTSYDIRDLLNGNTDAFTGYITDQPHQLDLLGVPYRIFHPQEQGIDFYGDILITTEKEIAERPQRVRAFTDASVRGWEYALEHIEESIAVIQKRYNSQNLPTAQLRFEAQKTKEMILSDVIHIGYINERRWQDIANTYMAQGLLPKEFRVSDFIYHPEPGFIEVVDRYRWQLAMITLFTFIFLLVLHTIRLRRVVQQRTARLESRESELARLNRHLEKLSFQDGLTGIANRRMFDQILEREWSRAQRHRQPLSLIMIDIDYFKQYNDHYGHQQGDNCLQQVARVLNGISQRAVDLVARYGGEEFVMLLPETDIEQATRLAEKCRNKIIEQRLPHPSSQAGDVVTISLGVSALTPSAETPPSALINAADRLLYTAKKNGRNRVESSGL
ncbi:MAG: diguanylate cyclase, partial [Mariprofundaceae bacterium]|nr:diguanylate cyclase [Mariprofundaceae bacterium]